MKTYQAFEELALFQAALNRERPEMSFTAEVVTPWEGPFKHWFRKEVPGQGASKSSGVYLIADMDRTIIYIGKAAANNLAAEIWGKFSAATSLSETDIPTFSNSSLAKWAPEDSPNRAPIISGDVLISAVIIEPKEYASLVEVYLQTWCATQGSWPELNKRIG